MTYKHALSDSDDGSPSPSPRAPKRPRISSMFPSSSAAKSTLKFPSPFTPHRVPLPSSSPIKAGSSSAAYSSPRQPYSAPKPPPTDSPNNPFGRVRTVAARTKLPEPTGYGRHMLLRCQFFRQEKTTKERPYRIVQVPGGYTFAHFRHLLSFIFGGTDVEGASHLFEIRKKVTMCNPDYKKGAIKKGTGDAWVRVACGGRGDPWVWTNAGFLSDSDDEDGDGDQSKAKQEEWRYEPEDAFTLEHLWPDPHHPDTSTAIVYQHQPGAIQVHISIFDPRKKRPDGSYDLTGVQKWMRKGFGNDPFVFEARGDVFLGRDRRDEENVTKDMSSPEARAQWNTRGAFERYLLQHATQVQDWEEDEEDELDADFTFSSPLAKMTRSSHTSSSSPLSTPARSSPFKYLLSSPTRPFRTNLFPEEESSTASSPLPLPKYTPAPLPGARKRLEYMARRIRKDSLKQEKKAQEKEARRRERQRKKAVLIEKRRKEQAEREEAARVSNEQNRLVVLREKEREREREARREARREAKANGKGKGKARKLGAAFGDVEVIDVDALDSDRDEDDEEDDDDDIVAYSPAESNRSRSIEV